MTDQQYDSKGLREYRQKAIELGELRKEVGDTVGKLTPAEAQKEFEKLTAATKELEDLRQQLSPKELFLVEYRVMVVNSHTVSFILPQGHARFDIITQAESLLPEWTLVDFQWAVDRRFTARASHSERFVIDGHVDGLDAKFSFEQEEQLMQRGLEMAQFEDVAAAACVFAVSTGGCLFDWRNADRNRSYRVRTRGGCLEIVRHKLYVSMGLSQDNQPDVSTAARLPSPTTLQSGSLKTV